MTTTRAIHIVEVDAEAGIDGAITDKTALIAICGDSFVPTARPTLDRPICAVCVALHNKNLDASAERWTATTYTKGPWS